MAKTWIECFQEAKIIAGAGRQPCKSWVTGLWPDFDSFWTSYTQNYKNMSRNDMMTSNTAFESWELIFLSAKIFNVLRTHPEELYTIQNT